MFAISHVKLFIVTIDLQQWGFAVAVQNILHCYKLLRILNIMYVLCILASPLLSHLQILSLLRRIILQSWAFLTSPLFHILSQKRHDFRRKILNAKLYWHSQDRASWYILIIVSHKMHYFSTLFCWRTLHVSGRFTVHHQESWYCINRNW